MACLHQRNQIALIIKYRAAAVTGLDLHVYLPQRLIINPSGGGVDHAGGDGPLEIAHASDGKNLLSHSEEIAAVHQGGGLKSRFRDLDQG